MNELSRSCKLKSTLFERITDRTAVAGVIGLGYVGLPLAVAIARAGFKTIGFDIDPAKPELIRSGRSYIGAVENKELGRLIADARFDASSDFSALAASDIVVICVPTPLTRH